jgi:hypothetical protein
MKGVVLLANLRFEVHTICFSSRQAQPGESQTGQIDWKGQLTQRLGKRHKKNAQFFSTSSQKTATRYFQFLLPQF